MPKNTKLPKDLLVHFISNTRLLINFFMTMEVGRMYLFLMRFMNVFVEEWLHGVFFLEVIFLLIDLFIAMVI